MSASPRVIRQPDELRRASARARAEGQEVGLVPTMGALHEGHLSLIRAAREENGLVIVSIFVNPKQFGPSEDLDAYPRDEARDLELVAAAGGDIVYAPSPEAMYPDGFATTVSVAGLTEVLCGAPSSRGRTHFDGVTTVVAKLFGAASPDRAYFGQKDAQQVAVIKRMTRDLDFGIEIRTLPIVREPDGLAMSSRNAYLSADERQQATAISRALAATERALSQAEGLAAALAAARLTLAEAGLEAEYLEARDAETLAAVEQVGERPILIAAAVPVGPARLIDNFVFDPQAVAKRAVGAASSPEVTVLQGGSR